VKIQLLDEENFIIKKSLQQVTNSVYFNLGSNPTSDGLFSYDIFGEIGSDRRKRQYAYIDLKQPFIRPIFYKMFTSMNRKLEDLFNGSKFFKLNDLGELEEDVNGETGISFFYRNYEKFKFKETGSNTRENNLALLKKTTKAEIFTSKLIVIPAYLRDFNPSSASGGRIADVDKINDFYSIIIRNTENLKKTLGFGSDLIFSSTESNIQKNLNNIFDYLSEYMAHKTGLINKSLLGKSVDYVTRSVITTNRFNFNKWDENPIPFGSTGIPLSQCVALFYPFFLKWINDFVDEYVKEFTHFTDKEGNEVLIKNIKQQFNDEKIKKNIINAYIKDPEHRFDSIKIEDDKGNKYPLKVFYKNLKRNFTKTDLLYLAAVDVLADKHVYITRDPVTSRQSIYPSRIAIQTTVETTPMQIEDRYLKNYPKIIPDYPVPESSFKDSVTFNASVTEALGADFDGDSVPIRGVFTVEANLEAEKFILSKSMIVNDNGESVRGPRIEVIQTLFSLTRD